NLCESIDRRFVRIAGSHRVYKEVEQLPRQVTRGRRSRADQGDDIFTGELCGLPVDRLAAVVVLIPNQLETERRSSHIVPTGERARDFLYVLLGVVGLAGHYVVDAHRE